MKKYLISIFSFLQSKTGFKSFGKSSVIMFPYRIWNKDRVEIGSNIHIGPFSFFAVSKEFKAQRFNPVLKLGDNLNVGSNLFISCIDNIKIENNVIISHRVSITDHEHGFDNPNIPVSEQSLKKGGPVLIKEGSFIGLNAVIMPGVTIGKNSVIGASSVVTRSVPDYSVAVGIPAKIFKEYNFKTKKWGKAKSIRK